MSSPTDNLLSAYHDGELTAAERSIVEQQISERDEAREELSEIKQISAMLKDLPRLPLPVEFPQQVLKGIEREMLIPSEASLDARVRSNTHQPIALSSRSSVSDTSPRRWLVGAAAVLTSAAGLMLMVTTFGDRSVTQSPRTSQLASKFDAPTEANAVAFSAPGLAGTLDSAPALGGAGVSALGQKVANSDASVTSKRDGDLGGTAFAAKMNEPNRPPVAAFNVPRGGDSVASMFLDQATLKSAEIGDVVDALQTLDDEIAVVRLTVVDRQEGLNQLQLLFAKNQIDPDAAASTLDKVKSLAAKSSPSSKPDAAVAADEGQQLMAVYVESNSEHLSAALHELSQNNLVQSLQVESPISVTEIASSNEESRDKFSEKQKSEQPTDRSFQSKNAVRRSSSQQALIDTLNQVRQPSKAGAEVVIEAHDRKGVEQSRRILAKKALPSAAAKDAAQSTSRQTVVQVPADALSQQVGQNSQSRSRANNFNVGQRALNQSKQSLDKQNDQRPMQVLFVVVNQGAKSDKPTSDAPTDAKGTEPAKTKPSIKSKAAKRPEGGGAA